MDFLSYEVLGLATLYRVLIIIHLLGLAVGAGAAFFSDFLFTNILKDNKINNTEYRILKLASKVVWIGLSIMLLSGLTIVIGDSERLLESTKFLAKMTILLVLVLNGISFHFKQIPQINKYLNKDLSKSSKFKSELANSLFIGGATSGVSWTAALVLGSMKSVDLTYTQIIFIYVMALITAALVALRLKKKMLG